MNLYKRFSHPDFFRFTFTLDARFLIYAHTHKAIFTISFFHSSIKHYHSSCFFCHPSKKRLSIKKKLRHLHSVKQNQKTL